MCCINMWPIINHYVATSILKNVHVRNQKLYNTNVLPTYTNKNKFVTYEKKKDIP